MGDGKVGGKVLDIKTADIKAAAPAFQQGAIDLSSHGWFNKHGIKASEVEVPLAVENAIKGRMIYELRKVGRIAPKGTEDISGDKWRRPPLAAEGCA
ncbi:hypothetical protein ACWDO7_21780 [Streptomyces sp. NPDC003656]